MKLLTAGIAFLFCFGCFHAVRAQTAAFPAAIATDSNLKVMVNGMQTTLTSNVSSTASTMAVAACGTIPANSLGTLDQEIFAIASCSGNVVTIATSAPGCTNGRGCDKTVAAAHVTGGLLSLFVDSWHHNALRVEVEAIETALGVNMANVIAPGSTVSSLTITTLTAGTITSGAVTTTDQITTTVAGGFAHGAVFTTNSANPNVQAINNGSGYAIEGIVTNGTAAIHGSSAGTGFAGQFTGGPVSIDNTSSLIIKNITPPTVGGAQLGLSSFVTASTSCGSLAGAAGCLEFNVSGTNHFIPYY